LHVGPLARSKASAARCRGFPPLLGLPIAGGRG
jgi:hypothetical protein